MGCEETREGIEEKMLYTRLEREDIRRQRKLLLEELKLSTGEVYEREKIPDFVDIKYIKEKKRKHYEKMVKKEIEKIEEEERKEKKKREKLEKELEEERKKEELLYMPLDINIKNQNSDLEDIYYLNYVLEKRKQEKEKQHDKKHKKEKKDIKRKSKEKPKRNSVQKKDEKEKGEKKEDKEEKYDYIQPVNAKIQTKVGSVRSMFGNNDNNNNKNEGQDNSDNDNLSDNESKNLPYVTPHLQPND